VHFHECCTRETLAILHRFKEKAALCALTDDTIINTVVYRVAHKLVNWLIICILNILQISLLVTEFTKIIRNEIFLFQCTTHNVVIPLCKLTGRFKSEHSC
jgi:hypothetical protein